VEVTGGNMTQEEKMDKLAELFDVDVGTLSADTELSSLAWDSMAILSVIALLKARFNKKISGNELRAMETIGDLLDVMV